MKRFCPRHLENKTFCQCRCRQLNLSLATYRLDKTRLWGNFFDYSGFKRFFGGFSVQRRLDTKLHPRKNITYTILPVISFSNNQTYKSRLRYEKLNMICIKLYKIFLIHKIWSFEVFKAFKTKKPRFFEALFLSFPALCTRRTDRQTDRQTHSIVVQ